MTTLRTARGRSLPLGATALADGINFSLLCRHGSAVSLVLYPLEEDNPLAAPPPDRREAAPPLVALEDSLIYELHVRGFTVHPSAGVSHPGTFAGLIEKIPYLKNLGVTAVELLPVHEFDEDDCPFTNPQTGERLRNFWGYNSIAFAAPKANYAATSHEHGQVNEFRKMVRAFHEAGIEVILDVVFNHTGEGN